MNVNSLIRKLHLKITTVCWCIWAERLKVYRLKVAQSLLLNAGGGFIESFQMHTLAKVHAVFVYTRTHDDYCCNAGLFLVIMFFMYFHVSVLQEFSVQKRDLYRHRYPVDERRYHADTEEGVRLFAVCAGSQQQ